MLSYVSTLIIALANCSWLCGRFIDFNKKPKDFLRHWHAMWQPFINNLLLKFLWSIIVFKFLKNLTHQLSLIPYNLSKTSIMLFTPSSLWILSIPNCQALSSVSSLRIRAIAGAFFSLSKLVKLCQIFHLFHFFHNLHFWKLMETKTMIEKNCSSSIVKCSECSSADTCNTKFLSSSKVV